MTLHFTLLFYTCISVVDETLTGCHERRDPVLNYVQTCSGCLYKTVSSAVSCIWQFCVYSENMNMHEQPSMQQNRFIAVTIPDVVGLIGPQIANAFYLKRSIFSMVSS